jgi:hypothetical protein
LYQNYRAVAIFPLCSWFLFVRLPRRHWELYLPIRLFERLLAKTFELMGLPRRHGINNAINILERLLAKTQTGRDCATFIRHCEAHDRRCNCAKLSRRGNLSNDEIAASPWDLQCDEHFRKAPRNAEIAASPFLQRITRMITD